LDQRDRSAVSSVAAKHRENAIFIAGKAVMVLASVKCRVTMRSGGSEGEEAEAEVKKTNSSAGRRNCDGRKKGVRVMRTPDLK